MEKVELLDGRIQLYLGDCLDVMPTLPPKSVDAIITDPPYGTTACKWDSIIPFKDMWRNIKYLLKHNKACLLFGAQPFSSAIIMSNPEWFKHEWVWEKDNPSNYPRAKNEPLRYHEQIIVFSDNKVNYFPQMWDSGKIVPPSRKNKNISGDYIFSLDVKRENNTTMRYPRTVLKYPIPRYNNKDGKFHPTQKPTKLLEYLLHTYSCADEYILDFTMGSGTTGVAVVNTNRRFIGIEKEEKYFEIAVNRIREAIDKKE